MTRKTDPPNQNIGLEGLAAGKMGVVLLKQQGTHDLRCCDAVDSKLRHRRLQEDRRGQIGRTSTRGRTASCNSTYFASACAGVALLVAWWQNRKVPSLALWALGNFVDTAGIFCLMVGPV
jgi:hypothetical protein